MTTATIPTGEKFAATRVTANGSERASVGLASLRTLWFNTGTLCNIECANCYIMSSPRNDSLVYISTEEVSSFLDEIREYELPTREIGFTGGEPFMNPWMPAILETTLERGFEVLVLTNAMQPMQRPRVKSSLLALLGRYGSRLTLRVSLDHYTQEKHETERGKNTWDKSMEGMDWLVTNGFSVDVASRSMWHEEEIDIRNGFANLYASYGWQLDAYSPKQLVVFPEMDGSYDVPEVTTECWGILGKSEADVMCSTSRMVVKRRGESMPVVLPCTLLTDDAEFEMGNTLAQSFGHTGGAIADGRVYLKHPHCYKFCVGGGASCSG